MSLQQSIALLLTSFPIMENDPEQELLVGIYETALSGLPDETASQAIMDYVKGSVDRDAHVFRPGASEVAAYARRKQASIDRTQQTINNVQNQLLALPEPPRPPEAERMAHVERVLGPERVKNKPIPPMFEADPNRHKPWNDAEVLRKSCMRIRRELAKEGKSLFPEDSNQQERKPNAENT